MLASTYQAETVRSSERSRAIVLGDTRPSPYSNYTLGSSSAFRPVQMTSSPLKTSAMAMHPPMPPPTNATSLPLALNRGRANTTRQYPPPAPATRPSSHVPRTCQPQLIATISAGFAKGDYLLREERGSNLYFDFFEEAYNFACQKGYGRMPAAEEQEFMDVIRLAHRSVPGGCRYNTGRLLLVLRKRLVPVRITPGEEEGDDGEPSGAVMDEGSLSIDKSGGSDSNSSDDERRRKKKDKKFGLGRSTNTLSTDSESSAYSSVDTSYVDSWE
eukprot:CAMPEP_0181095346 /NCGR_PEP_ID=MMETSP1071-20121207/10469_1 /TAXON_ID=35127 /ORGANISM="Thalassiosira sp., Strain NH16" /LENGTH=271 /DNA_ID=CAMNT_0023177719 /DNA_START=67 /DNA_END=882 /DNA_ORIENTATION=+